MAKVAEMSMDDVVIARKGAAQGIDPGAEAAVDAVRRAAERQPETQGREGEGGQVTTTQAPPRPIIPDPPMTVARKAVPIRLPEPIAESLRNMAFVSRRTQQDIMEAFITRGLEDYWRDRSESS